MTCLMSYFLENAVNSFDNFCVPLSLTRTSGIPCHAKVSFNAAMMSLEEIIYYKSVNCSNG